MRVSQIVQKLKAFKSFDLKAFNFLAGCEGQLSNRFNLDLDQICQLARIL